MLNENHDSEYENDVVDCAQVNEIEPTVQNQELPKQLPKKEATLNYYLLLLRFGIMETSTNKLGKATLDALCRRLTEGRKITQSNQKIAFSSKSKLNSKPKGKSTYSSTSGFNGRVVDLHSTTCALCQQPILSKTTGGAGGRRVKLYVSCEHVFHSTCSTLNGSASNGRCSLCH